MKSLGLYIHIPFCRSKCLYCDFCSVARSDDDTVSRYVRALCRDLESKRSAAESYTVDSVYFGGGTPTLLSVDQLLLILNTVFRCYRLSPNAEITAECNPATGDALYFEKMRRGGFNRLSIGLQSAWENELRALGRIHSFSDFQKTFSQARSAGFENISADLMLGIPEQTRESWLGSIDRLSELAPQHISAYSLSVEEGTPFGRMRQQLHLPDEEDVRAMYFEGIERLSSYGYAQYEISNFAREGYESRHNLKYWNCDEYLGFGPAAHSDFCGERFGNSRDLSAYINGEDIESERNAPDLRERMNEYVMLRMRLTEGVVAKDFSDRFGVDFARTFGDSLAAYARYGLVRQTDRGVAFTAEGFAVSNAVLSEVLDFSE